MLLDIILFSRPTRWNTYDVFSSAFPVDVKVKESCFGSGSLAVVVSAGCRRRKGQQGVGYFFLPAVVQNDTVLTDCRQPATARDLSPVVLTLFLWVLVSQ